MGTMSLLSVIEWRIPARTGVNRPLGKLIWDQLLLRGTDRVDLEPIEAEPPAVDKATEA